MRLVLQRVTRSSVTVDRAVVGSIAHGWLVLLGVAKGDTDDDADRMAEKVVGLRAFEDDGGKMNRSVVDVGGAVLVVSQFTLLGDCRKGRRPGFDDAAEPAEANRLYERFADRIRAAGVPRRNRRLPGRDEGRTRQRRAGDTVCWTAGDYSESRSPGPSG